MRTSSRSVLRVTEPPASEEQLTDGMVRRRAASGVVFVGSLGMVNLVLGFLGSIVLARMLEPRDFGVVAVGATLMAFTTSLADGGLGSGLIRREEPPTRTELKASLGLQMTLVLLLAGVGAAIGAVIGGDGLVVALMMVALPIAALPTPGRVVMARAMRFKQLSVAEALGALGYYAWAVGGVLAGMGVWALASAVIVKALLTTAGIISGSGLGTVLPSYRGVSALRPLIAFGLRFQAISLAAMGREQGLNAGIAAISGVVTLGYWSLTRRLLSFPALLFQPLHRVAFPLLSRTLAQKRDPGAMLDRGIGVSAVVSGLVLGAMAASASEVVPAVFGGQWGPSAVIFQYVCVSLLVSGPVSVVAVGFLYASDAPGVVLRATIVHTLVLFAVTFSLLPSLGPKAIGIGSLAGAIVDVLIMSRGVATRCSARPLAQLLPVVAIGLVAGAIGMLVTAEAGSGFAAGVAGAVAAAAADLALLLVFRRRTAADTAGLLVQAVRTAPVTPARDRPRPAGDQLKPAPVADGLVDRRQLADEPVAVAPCDHRGVGRGSASPAPRRMTASST